MKVRIGILGPARIAPHAIVAPSRLHTEASVTCVHFAVQTPWQPQEWRWLRSQGGGALMDLGTEAELEFPDSFTAHVSCSMISTSPACRLSVRGELGSLEVIGFIAPHLPGSSFTLERNGHVTQFSVDGPTTFQAQFAHVMDVMQGSAIPLTGGADAIANMVVMDAIRKLAPVSAEPPSGCESSSS